MSGVSESPTRRRVRAACRAPAAPALPEHADALRRLARPHCHREPDRARGLCFQASADLGLAVRAQGLLDAPQIVRWIVKRELGFREHWALGVDADWVLDPTAVQVDGRVEPLRQIAGYPAHYVGMRRYPLALVERFMLEHRVPDRETYSRRALFGLHLAFCRYDLGCARLARAPLQSAAALGRLAREAVYFALGYLLEIAIARMSKLLLRLS
jgi:hypothetical protein